MPNFPCYCHDSYVLLCMYLPYILTTTWLHLIACIGHYVLICIYVPNFPCCCHISYVLLCSYMPYLPNYNLATFDRLHWPLFTNLHLRTPNFPCCCHISYVLLCSYVPYFPNYKPTAWKSKLAKRWTHVKVRCWCDCSKK